MSTMALCTASDYGPFGPGASVAPFSGQTQSINDALAAMAKVCTALSASTAPTLTA